MSLIPSESANFPDSFRANVGWRLAEKVEPARVRAPGRRTESARPKPVDAPVPTREEAVAPEAANSSLPEAVAAAPPKDDDQQLKLIPDDALDPDHSAATPGTADMNALFRHLFASAAASSISIKPTNGAPPVFAPETIAELPVSASKAADEVPAIAPNAPVLPNASSAELAAPTEPVLDQLVAESRSADSPLTAGEQPSAVATGLPEPSPAPGPVTIETPAQAQHILELIAAAVQRGALVGETGPPPEPNIALPATSSPSTNVPVPSEPVLPAAATAEPPMAAPPAEIAKSAEAPKAPARIRITPRKIKPRVLPQPTVEPESSVAPASPDLSSQPARERNSTPTEPPISEEPATSRPAMSSPSAELPSRPAAPRFEQPARKLPPTRLALAQSDLLSFTARERRNRWIGFGLSEIAAVTALVLLARFGFVHHFPDPTLKLLVFILIFAAAAVVAALPIAFFRNDPRRWARPE